jgi:hypothetical protein
MKVLKLAVFLFAALVGFVSAQVANPFWMFESRSSMDQYKIQQISQASVTLWSGGSVDEINTRADAYAYNKTDDTLDVLRILRDQNLTLSVARPNQDNVGLYAWLYDKKGRPLFNGGNCEKPINIGIEWGLSDSLMLVSMQSYPRCFVTIPNVVSAKILLRDEHGNIVEIKYLQIDEGGEIEMDYYDLGRNADLAITVDNGDGQYDTSLVSLRGDAEAPIQLLTGNHPNLSIQGLWDYEDQMDFVDYLTVTPESYNGYGQSPILRMKVSSARSFYLFTKTTEGEKPLVVTVTDASTGDQVDYTPVEVPGSTSSHVVVDLPHAGIWYTKYSWASFDNEVYYQYYGGGKGE